MADPIKDIEVILMPDGLRGPAGKDAYELAVSEGFEGTLDEWLESIIGPEGKNAYELAVEEGFEGTLEEWLESLRGPKGDQGERGPQGPGLSDEDAQEVLDEVDTLKDMVIGIGSGEGPIGYPTLADALAADIPDNVIFQVDPGNENEGIWRRDSSAAEGAVFLREFGVTREEVAPIVKSTAGGKLPLDDHNVMVSGEIGDITTPEVGTDPNIVSTTLEATEGDTFVITGRGGSTSPLFAVLDQDNRIVMKAEAGATETDYVLRTPQDGLVIFNTYKADSGDYGIRRAFEIQEAIKTLENELSDIRELTDGQNINYISPGPPDGIQEGEFYLNSFQYNQVFEWRDGAPIRRLSKKGHTYFFKGVPYYFDENAGRYIPKVSGGEKLVGTRVIHRVEGESVTPELVSGVMKGYSVDVEIGDIITVSGFSSGAYVNMEAVIYVDETGKVIHTAYPQFNKVTYAFVCWAKGKVYVNIQYEGEVTHIRNGATENKKLTSRVNFEKDLTVRDFENDIAQFDFYSPDFMGQVYSAYDTLMAQNPDYITRTDLSVFTGIPYPEYANGVSAGHPDYLETPAYKTFMYKLAEPDGIQYNPIHKKPTLFIINGQHADEQAAIITSYLIAKQLCDNIATDSNMFELRRNFDIYIIPCLNGYGLIHNIRNNANDVNLNRNWPNYLTDEGEGDYPGSEFETQLLINTLDQIKPEVPIDFHNFFSLEHQSYPSIYSDYASRALFNNYTKSSQAIINKYPEYFGTKYRIYNGTGVAPKDINDARGTFAVWAYSKFNNNYGMTYEVSANINFLDGVYQPTNKPAPENGKEVMAVNEHFFRELLFSVGKQVADHPETVWNTIS